MLIVVRHAEAGIKGSWDGPDLRRPLSAEGHDQAEDWSSGWTTTRSSGADPSALLGGRLPALAPGRLLLGRRTALLGAPPLPEAFPPFLDAPGVLAILAARSFDIPLSLSASYCCSFLTFADLDGISHSFVPGSPAPSDIRRRALVTAHGSPGANSSRYRRRAWADFRGRAAAGRDGRAGGGLGGPGQGRARRREPARQRRPAHHAGHPGSGSRSPARTVACSWPWRTPAGACPGSSGPCCSSRSARDPGRPPTPPASASP
jgi:hypothetical protein